VLIRLGSWLIKRFCFGVPVLRAVLGWFKAGTTAAQNAHAPLVNILEKYSNIAKKTHIMPPCNHLFSMELKTKNIGKVAKTYRALLIPHDKEEKSNIELNE
jgi:hypothetical protein